MKFTPEVKSLPNAKVLSEKQAIVEALSERLGNATAGVLVDYKGINVAEDTELRRQLREAGISSRRVALFVHERLKSSQKLVAPMSSIPPQ